MPKTLAIANQKGGVAKTTTAINLTASLQAMHHATLLIDLDPQGSATVGCGLDKQTVTPSINDVLLKQAAIKAAIRTSQWGFDLLPSNSHLTTAEVKLLTQPQREQQLKQHLATLGDTYEFILIDCPPSLNMLTINALVASDSVLVPIQCEYYALEGLTSLLHSIDRIRQMLSPSLKLEGLLRTMYDGRNRLAVDVSGQLTRHFGDKVYHTVIPRNVRLAEAPSHGLPAMYYDKQCQGAAAYLALAAELLRKSNATSRHDLAAHQA